MAIVPGLVSTIIPVFNRPDQLPEAVSSALQQNYRPIEIIIVDDGSTDGLTSEIAQRLAAANPDIIRFATQKNGGPGVAREHGRQLAKGEFVQYLDSDDILLPKKFERQVRALNESPDADVAYGKTRYRHADGRVEPDAWKGSGTRRATMFPEFLNERWWDTPNPLYRESICQKAGPWSALRLEEDWEYDCRIAARGGKLVWVPDFVCEVRAHGGERLSGGSNTDPQRMRTRARSHSLIWQHGLEAGLPDSAPKSVGNFARSLFLLARQCGAAGLPKESNDLLTLALTAAAGGRARKIDMKLYEFLAMCVGWRAAGRLAAWLDQSRGNR